HSKLHGPDTEDRPPPGGHDKARFFRVGSDSPVTFFIEPPMSRLPRDGSCGLPDTAASTGFFIVEITSLMDRS
ncbi:hypothetical protein A2U01_0073030, partial [Trifolium medium]|nr:hypothetical protein [Trifolium medium]